MTALAAAIGVGIALLLCVVRLFVGPTLYDRTLAANGVIIKIAIIAAAGGVISGAGRVYRRRAGVCAGERRGERRGAEVLPLALVSGAAGARGGPLMDAGAVLRDSCGLALSGIVVAVGLLLIAGGALGLLRFPDLYTRLHAANVADVVGSVVVVLGLGDRGAGLGHRGAVAVACGAVDGDRADADAPGGASGARGGAGAYCWAVRSAASWRDALRATRHDRCAALVSARASGRGDCIVYRRARGAFFVRDLHACTDGWRVCRCCCSVIALGARWIGVGAVCSGVGAGAADGGDVAQRARDQGWRTAFALVELSGRRSGDGRDLVAAG